MPVNNYKVVPDDNVFRYYFYFMQERMNIFWRKYEGRNAGNLTTDPIMKTYKFTNVYRALDRVSQYLIQNVIYKDINRYTPEDTLLRILVFKIFNKIETWEYLEHTLPPLTVKNFNVTQISEVLTSRKELVPIFSNAYMMTGTHKLYNHLKYKHEKWLAMVKEEFTGKNVIGKLLKAKSLEEVYLELRGCSFLGSFLAYQYAIDFNYSPYLNFSENSFVKAGIGAIRGIKKCFTSYGENYEAAIYYTFEHLDELRRKYGFTKFLPLPSHEPTLIDLQNCFCETDKYLRVKLPELLMENVRIKQKYKEGKQAIDCFFPPKWGINKFNQ